MALLGAVYGLSGFLPTFLRIKDVLREVRKWDRERCEDAKLVGKLIPDQENVDTF